jgi:hypothetical protein
MEGGDFGGGRVKARDGGIDMALANAPGNHLGVLRAKIQNENLLRHQKSLALPRALVHQKRLIRRRQAMARQEAEG